MKTTTAKTGAFTVLMLAIAMALAFLWCLWALWTAVMPEVWPGGPEGLVNPGYWLFVGEWTLLVIVARLLRPAAGK